MLCLHDSLIKLLVMGIIYVKRDTIISCTVCWLTIVKLHFTAEVTCKLNIVISV